MEEFPVVRKRKRNGSKEKENESLEAGTSPGIYVLVKIKNRRSFCTEVALFVFISRRNPPTTMAPKLRLRRECTPTHSMFPLAIAFGAHQRLRIRMWFVVTSSLRVLNTPIGNHVTAKQYNMQTFLHATTWLQRQRERERERETAVEIPCSRFFKRHVLKREKRRRVWKKVETESP